MTTEVKKKVSKLDEAPPRKEVNELTSSDVNLQAKLKLDTVTFTFRLVFLLVLIIMICALVSTTDRMADLDYFNHIYADKRKILKWLPNSMNVLLNLPYLPIGLLGLYLTLNVSDERIEFAHERINFLVFFISTAMITLGSSFYYLEPCTPRLFWDRLPRALSVTMLFYILISERIDSRSGRSYYGSFIIMGFIGFVFLIFKQMNNRGDPYILLQFSIILVSPFILYFYQSRYSHHIYYYYTFGFFLSAKILEMLDHQIYKWTLHSISGTGLKLILNSLAADLTQTSILHTKYLLPNTGCEKSSDIKKCLMSLHPQNLTDSIAPILGNPPSVNPPNLPFSPRGNELIGLVIVDGIIVTKPVLEALKEPIIDVPIFIQTCGCEEDPALQSVDAMTDPALYKNFLENYFNENGWQNYQNLADSVFNLYSEEISKSVELGFESFLAQISVVCGNDDIASTASKSFKSPVFRSHLVAPPSLPYPQGPNLYSHYAFHSWDYPVAGAGFFNSSYIPTNSDLNLGNVLLQSWIEMVYLGNATKWYNRECTSVIENGVTIKCPESKCPALYSLGFNQNFQWVN